MLAKAKKMSKQSTGFKAEMEGFEEKLLATAAERREEEATAQVQVLSDTALKHLGEIDCCFLSGLRSSQMSKDCREKQRRVKS